MGYPAPAYRTSAARVLRHAGQRVLGSQGANDNRPRGNVRRLPSGTGKHGYNPLQTGRIPKPRQPFGYAGRLALRRKALGGLARGMRLRSEVARAVARFLWDGYAKPWIARSLRPHPMPGWTLHGTDPMWGNPYFAGLTNAHTTHSVVRHNEVPGSGPGGDNWDGPPFDWAEYDSLTEIINPITGADFYDFLQVGRGDMGTGPDPRKLSRYLSPRRNQNESPGRNPWAEPAYNPLWQGHGQPSAQPSPRPIPRRRPNPGPDVDPSIDPDSAPIHQPRAVPRPVPRKLLPQRRPNPFRSPIQQTQWGPQPIPNTKPRPKTKEKDEPFAFPWPINKPNPVARPPTGTPIPTPTPNQPPITRVPTVTSWSPNVQVRTREKPNRRDEPPGIKVKERKMKAPAWVLGILNGVTEFSDLLRALHKALPRKYQRRGKLIIDQWKDVYLHFDELDLTHAVRSVLRDQIEDQIYGRIGRASGKAANRQGRLYDPLSRSFRKISNTAEGGDVIDAVLDRIFGKDT